MRMLIWTVMVLAAVWGGYWVLGSRALEHAANRAFADASATGRTADYSALSVQGFPSRFDLTIDDIKLADPATGFGWQAAFVQVLSLSYKPWHVIAVFADAQTLTTPVDRILVQSAKLQASVIVTPGPSLALDRATLVGTALAAKADAGWSLGADEVRIATQRDPSMNVRHQIGLAIRGLTPDPAWPRGALPAVVDTVALDATATLAAPLDRFAKTVQLTEIVVKQAALRWGDLRASATGALTADEAGRAAGTLTVTVENWRLLLPVLVEAGVVAPDFVPALQSMLGALAQPDPATLTLPLTFANGRTSLGPIPLGPAPLLNRP